MIESFVESWALFQSVYLSGLLVATLLSVIGIAVVARDQIFLGAAVSQASLLGISAGIWLDGVVGGAVGGWLASDTVHSLMGGVFAVAGSLAITATATRSRETREAITGWLFLLGSSASVLIVANSPHGMAEVTRLLSSTLIGANETDVAIFVALLATTAMALALRWRPILLMLTDAETAQASGVAVQRWDGVLAVWLGMSVAWSIHVAGMVFTFGCLVLPGLVAKSFVREMRSLFFVAPLVALAATLTSFVVANAYDLPPGQLTVALLCAAQAVGWGIGGGRRAR